MRRNVREIVWTPTASDALQLLKKDKGFDLYLVDYFLPDATGLELCRSIRTLQDTTPIVLVTASRTLTIEGVRGACANALVRKGEPTFVDHLRQTVNDLLPPLAPTETASGAENQ